MANNVFKLDVPTLKQISLVKVSNSLMKYNSILEVIVKNADLNFVGLSYNVRVKTEELLHQKITSLNIPECLKPLLHSFIQIVMLEMQKWLSLLHLFVFDSDRTRLLKCTNYIHWTPHGEVDGIQSARELLTRDNELSITERYRIASVFYLEDEVRNIWNEFHQQLKMEHTLSPPTGPEHFWTTRMILPNHTYERNAQLFNAVNNNNIYAVKYFWSVMTEEEKNSNIIACFNNFNRFTINYPSILLFLFSQMNEQHLNDFLLSNCASCSNYCVLQIFITNPIYLDIFTLILKRFGFSFIKHINEILSSVVNQIIGFNGDKCEKIFLYLWKQFSLHDPKSLVVSDGLYCNRFSQLQDLSLLKLVFDDINMVDRRKNFTEAFKHLPFKVNLVFLVNAAQQLILDDDQLNIFKKKCTDNVVKICKDYFCYSSFLILTKTESEFVNKCQMLDNFVKYSIAPEENVTDFKRGLIFNHCIVFDLVRNLIYKGESQLSLIDQCLRWCEITENEIIELKRNLIYESNNVTDCIVKELLEKGKHDLSDNILNWCLLTPEEIVEFKTKRLVNSYNFSRIFTYGNKNGTLDKFKKCLNWCFSDQVQCNRHQREFLFKILDINYFRFRAVDNIAALLGLCNYDSKRFKHWCCDLNWDWNEGNVNDLIFDFLNGILNLYYSKEEINVLKSDILVSDFGVGLCIDYCAYLYEHFLSSSKESIFTLDFSAECNFVFVDSFLTNRIHWCFKRFLIWLNPSLETVNKLKRKIENEKLPRLPQHLKFVFFKLIDRVAKKKLQEVELVGG